MNYQLKMRSAFIALLILMATACQEQEVVNPTLQDLPDDAEGLEKLLATNPDNPTTLEIYWQLYKAYRHKEPTRALNALASQVELAKQTENYVYLGKAHFGQGWIYDNKMGEHIRALDSYIVSINALEQSNQPELIAISLNNIGRIFDETGNHEYAERFFKRAQDIHQETGDTTRLVLTTMNLGISNYKKKEPNYELAEAYCKEALTLNEANQKQQKHYFNRGYTQLGIINYKQGNYQEAVDHYLKSLQYIDKDNEEDDKKVIAFANIGEAMMDSEEHEEAKKWLNKALELSGFVTAENNVVIYNILARLHQHQNDHLKSAEYLEKAIDISNKEAINQHLQEALQLIRVSYRELNQSGKPVSTHRYDHVLAVDGKQDILEKELVEKTNFEALQTILGMTIELDKEKKQKEAEAALKAFYIKVALALLLLVIGVTVYLRYRNRRMQQKHESFKDELFGKVERFLHTMEN